ncbi:MAG: 1-acyl-sn-glycerol-3-phosphate acyltransferase, partial [Oscillospiraceae bacterium]|nr:1-acyl-sn-glycerol-3-phosphate acyltransferase [Oscillospiraceae bacterium]
YAGTENIPADRGFILACNHRSYLDPIFLAHKVNEQLRFMAKEELFGGGLLTWVVTALGAFPVSRGSNDMSAMAKARDIVGGGGVLAMFPEGTRSKDGTPLRPKPGVAMIAGHMGCGVLPAAISYSGRLGFRRRVLVRYGTLITPEGLAIDPKASSTIRKAAVRIMDEIVKLIEK